MPETPRASIVMVAWGKRPVTESTLETLERALGPKLHTEFELVLVDNASPDDTLELFAVWERKGATVLRLPENRNFAGGCNAGAEAARGEVLLFLNNDMVFFPGVLEALVENALEPDVGMVGARLLFPDGGMQHGGVVWRKFGDTPTAVHLFHFDAGDLPHGRAILDLDAVTGACAVMRRTVFFDCGGFDTLFVNGLEDVDLCVKVRLKGLRIVYRGDLSLVHLESATRKGQNDVARQNIEKFNTRYAGAFDDDSELIRDTFDGELSVGDYIDSTMLHAEGAAVTVEGTLSGIAGESAEGRALLAALEQARLGPAAIDRQPVWVTPRLTDYEHRLLQGTRGRVSSPLGLTVHVPVGRFGVLPAGENVVTRLAQMPGRRRALGTQGAWAATPWLAEALVAHGLSEHRVAYLPPSIPIVTAGRGGAGVLVLLGGHDLPAAA
ncbi:MAG TPA: glycosyltransferase family 2 protein, partial [Solirubrobacteraceae bacterium]|nr:glycosyltransferase family 2 protein [Solirubrobacteraceae bacterium]